MTMILLSNFQELRSAEEWSTPHVLGVRRRKDAFEVQLSYKGRI